MKRVSVAAMKMTSLFWESVIGHWVQGGKLLANVTENDSYWGGPDRFFFIKKSKRYVNILNCFRILTLKRK